MPADSTTDRMWKLAEENDALNVRELVMSARSGMQPAIQWFLRKFNVQLRLQMEVFRYVRFFCPVQVQTLHPDPAALEELRRLPLLNSDKVQALCGLPSK